mmetsp:Transcript_40414/g.160452  ORF Transcript_40414/g.160452 Transcript_40414/m.160452 type:complete len:213 (+) Transcript_40414:1637-2275(+)
MFQWHMENGDLAGPARVVMDQVIVRQAIGPGVLVEKDLEGDLEELHQPLEMLGNDTSRFPASKLEVIRALGLVMDLDPEKQQGALVATVDQVKALVLEMCPARVQAQGRVMPLEKVPVRDLFSYLVPVKVLERVPGMVLVKVPGKVLAMVRVKVLATDLERDLEKPPAMDRRADPGKTRKWAYRTSCVYWCTYFFFSFIQVSISALRSKCII